MADYVFKVQLLLPENVVETVILRQYIDPVDRCFDRFKSNLIQRFDILTNATFKMMWIDNDGDKISIYNEEDLRTYMELKGTKIFVEVDDGSDRKEKKSAVDNAAPMHRAPVFIRNRFAERERPMCGGRYRMFAQPDSEVNGNNVNAGSASSGAQPVLHTHVGVTCDGCNCAIRGYRYKCVECPDYDLCFSCEMKKIHGDHMMLRIVKPLDRPFSRHFLKTMLKQRCRDFGEDKDKERRARGRHSTAFVNFDDIMTDIAKNISVNCTAQPANETNKNAEQNKTSPIDPKQFALSSETFAKAGEVLSNLAQHFVSVMDPFAVHEFIPTTEPTGANTPAPTGSGTQNVPNKMNDSQTVVIDENQENNAKEAQMDASPAVVPTPPQSNTPTESAKDLVTIEDDVEIPSAPRESSPTPDWAMVDAFGIVEEARQPKNTGAIPKTPAIPTPTASIGSADAVPLPNYAVLARDLEDHLHHTLKSQASQTPPQMPIVHHPNPKINEAIVTMTSMGFSNGGGWLTRLLENVDGDIPKALEKLHPSQ
ncbi:hypothetical protein HA402_015786 [Bradysia odoriphaga]|nr:hypothetical protein HA402_015786 [Bradysia odoriphaga]